jgi:hypothetical protein
MVKVGTIAPPSGVDVGAHSEQKSMQQPTTTQQECKSYRPGMFRSSYRKYEHDMTFFFRVSQKNDRVFLASQARRVSGIQ